MLIYDNCHIHVITDLTVKHTYLYQGRIEPPKVARGHATHIDGIVLNVTKFRIQRFYSLICIALSVGRSARTIEVLRLKCLD